MTVLHSGIGNLAAYLAAHVLLYASRARDWYNAARDGRAGIQVEFEKVTDMNEIMSYDVLSTPALSLNGKVVSAGKIPARSTIVKWMQGAG